VLKRDRKIILSFGILFLLIINGCGLDKASNSHFATLNISLDKSQKNKIVANKISSRSINTLFPDEATQLNIEITNEVDNDIIAVDIDLSSKSDDVAIRVPIHQNLHLNAEVWANNILLYSDEQAVNGLYIGEHRSLTLALESLISLSLDDENTSPAKANTPYTYKLNITGLVEPNLEWYVDGIKWGNAEVGTITPDGLYLPPSDPTHNQVLIKVNPTDTPSFSLMFSQTIEILPKEVSNLVQAAVSRELSVARLPQNVDSLRGVSRVISVGRQPPLSSDSRGINNAVSREISVGLE